MILILGGTAEARALAASLGGRAITSLAGRTREPRMGDGENRTGGFGGPEGLARYLAENGIRKVIDATHPFAARITAHAAQACAATGTPLVVLNRPAWEPVADDDWRPARDTADAARLIGELPPGTRVLLTTGRQEAAAFAGLPHRFRLRAIEAPEPPLPRHCDVLLARGPFTLEGERRLLRDADVLVTKNSGGPHTAPKLRAARERRIPVVMIQRPPLPPGVPVRTTVEEVLRDTGGG